MKFAFLADLTQQHFTKTTAFTAGTQFALQFCCLKFL